CSPLVTDLRLLTRHETRFDRQLRSGETKCLFRYLARHAFHLVDDACGLDYTYPLFRRAFALAHTGFERLLRHRLVGEDADPDLSAALDVARHRDTGSFNLPRSNPAHFQRLQAVIAKRDFRPAR